MEFAELEISVPEGYQIIIGQSHFIKTVEDLYEALATSSPGIKFGIAFCEASGKALVRSDGTDGDSTAMAVRLASDIGAGHCFVIVLRGSFPINVLDRVRSVQEVVGVYCATSNDVTVILAKVGKGRAILGIVDGVSPKGSETRSDKKERHRFLRTVGYKK
ncbi:MAG: adenosine-specific kinase [Thaumarchaeota archaeon]|nr:adenosine-specific kinase [Nitrososphaerota archaeon]